MNKLTITAVLALLTVSACAGASATVVRKDRTGGRIALEGGYMPAMAEARLLMVDQCAGRFDMLELGEAVEFRCRAGESGATTLAASAVSDR